MNATAPGVAPSYLSAAENLENIGDAIDRLVTVEMRLSRYSRGVIVRLYDAAREAQGGGALSMKAALSLRQALQPGDVAFVVTGVCVPDYLPLGETDGPPGAAAIALALSNGLGVVPVLLTEAPLMENLAQTALGAGLGLRTPESVRRVPYCTTVLPIAEDASADEQARAYLDEYAPKAVIVIEKLAVNAKGIAHTATGKPAGQGRARAEVLIDQARQRGILTIGIGDNGNEIGFGLMESAVRDITRYGDMCQCECAGGNAAQCATDILLPANASNWGGYGLAAALAAVTGQPDVLQTEASGRRTIEACVAFGAADGSTGRHILQVDGTPLETQTSLLSLLRTIVVNGLAEPRPRAF